jgi:hypothetical protein
MVSAFPYRTPVNKEQLVACAHCDRVATDDWYHKNAVANADALLTSTKISCSV